MPVSLALANRQPGGGGPFIHAVVPVEGQDRCAVKRGSDGSWPWSLEGVNDRLRRARGVYVGNADVGPVLRDGLGRLVHALMAEDGLDHFVGALAQLAERAGRWKVTTGGVMVRKRSGTQRARKSKRAS
jgi:hypothetical protein